jgi:[acyl-carrier-protein] S-malonyltransferase
MRKKIGMLFPGYGSQFVGMGKELYDASRVMQEYFEEASICLDNNFVKLCFASSDDDICRMQNAYPLVFLVSAALVRLLQEEGITPDIVAGYNTGEFAAVHAAGGIGLPDGLYLLNKYALAFDELLPVIGDCMMMRVTGVATEKLEEIIQKVQEESGSSVPVAIYQGEMENIIGGFADPVRLVCERVNDEVKRSKSKVVSNATGFHSTLMDSVLNRLLMYVEKVDVHDLSVPLVANMFSKPIQEKDQVRQQLLGTINKPLYWREVLEQFADCDILIEVGPGNSLRAQLEERYPDKVVRSVNKPEDIVELKTLLNEENKSTTE